MRYAHKKDANHNTIAVALTQIGVGVVDLSAAGNGLSDLLCFWRGQVKLIEIKDGDKSPSKRRLTPAQVELHATALQYGVQIPVVENVDQALAVFGARAT